MIAFLRSCIYYLRSFLNSVDMNIYSGTVQPMMKSATDVAGPMPGKLDPPSAWVPWLQTAALAVGMAGAHMIASYVDPSGTVANALNTIQPAFKY